MKAVVEEEKVTREERLVELLKECWLLFNEIRKNSLVPMAVKVAVTSIVARQKEAVRSSG